MAVPIPFRLAEHADDPAWTDWLAAVPRLVDELLREWQLAPDGDPSGGDDAIVLPVRTRAGDRAVVKASRPRREVETEHLALRYWDGRGAVRLLRADPRRSVLLLERADPTRDLTDVPVDDALEIATGLYPRLHVAPPPQLRTLSSLVAERVDLLPRLTHDPRVPRRLAEHALAVARDLADDPATDGTLIHTDLHFGTVLASFRDEEPWLAIAPKPLSGDPAYEIAPLLRGRWDELPQDRIRDGLRGRLWVIAQATGWDEDRIRDWALLREVADLQDDADAGALSSDRLDRGIQFAKAMEK